MDEAIRKARKVSDTAVVDLCLIRTTLVFMSVTLSVKVSLELRKKLEQVARKRQTTASNLLRHALQLVVTSEAQDGSCYELCEDLFDDLGGGPRDLSTNRKHLKGFGS